MALASLLWPIDPLLVFLGTLHASSICVCPWPAWPLLLHCGLSGHRPWPGRVSQWAVTAPFSTPCALRIKSRYLTERYRSLRCLSPPHLLGSRGFSTPGLCAFLPRFRHTHPLPSPLFCSHLPRLSSSITFSEKPPLTPGPPKYFEFTLLISVMHLVEWSVSGKTHLQSLYIV